MANNFTQTIFQIYVRIKDEEWNVYKRFSQFHQVHNQLKKIYPKIGKFEFPPKKNFGKKVISPLMHYIVYCSFVFIDSIRQKFIINYTKELLKIE